MAVKKTTAQQTNTTHKTAVKKSTVKKPAAAKTAAKKSVKTVTKDKPADYRIGELDQYLFGQGTHYEIYKKMGAHFVKDGKKSGVSFAVWAPHARSVSVIGEFNGWSEDANVMKRQEPLGIYTAFVPEAQLGQLYKYCIETQTEISFTKLIHLPSAQNTVRVLLPLPQISVDFPGMTVTGSQSVPRQI